MSQIHDLRSYLQVLESAGQLARIVRPVSLDHELADVAAALESSRVVPRRYSSNADAADRGGGPIAAWPVFSYRGGEPDARLRWRWGVQRGRWSR